MSKLKFRPLNNNNGKIEWIALLGKGDKRTAIFPNGFQPKQGRSYSCNIIPVPGGIFTQGDEVFNVALAVPKNKGIADNVPILNNSFSSLALALTRAGFKPSF